MTDSTRHQIIQQKTKEILDLLADDEYLTTGGMDEHALTLRKRTGEDTSNETLVIKDHRFKW